MLDKGLWGPGEGFPFLKQIRILLVYWTGNLNSAVSSHLQGLSGCTKWKDSYRKKAGERELLAKLNIFGGNRMQEFVTQIAASSLKLRKDQWDRLPFSYFHQKTADCSTEITFMGEVKTAIRLGVKSRFVIMSF